MMAVRFLAVLAYLSTFVYCYAPTDTLQDADVAQSGYLPNHNLHPATVGSSIFGQLWKNEYNAKEEWYAKPLVFTPATTGKELVFLASNMNIIRTIDALTGNLIQERVVQPPFLQSDIGCGDIPNFIGITGTPIVDPGTEIVYFFSKGYKGGAASGGMPNGQYSFYAVDINTLQDKPGFPISIEGHSADNDPSKYFIGGTVLQRPSLTEINGVIIGAFGGHCDLFNYTGMLVGVSKTPGVGVTSIYTMEATPGAPSPQPLDLFSQQGGKAGIWHSGMGLATDGSRLFLATGNGQGHANGNVPSSGRLPLSTLDEVVANFKVSVNGSFSLIDYFEPYEYVNMDAADRDLGSSGVTLLDPGVFYGTGVSRIAVCVGKNGKAYVMDANMLGGFKQGAGGTDGVLQTIVAGNAVFGGVGSYPLEGGYIYFTPVGLPTYCYKMGFDGAGKPFFTQVGATEIPSAGRVGVGIPTITTYKGQAGTGILWITDVNLGLRAFKSVPVNNVLIPLPLPALPGLGKFQRPAFGNGRVFVTTRSFVYCLGSPVALPLQCTQPVDFGGVEIGTTSTFIITCTAQIAITKINGCSTMDKTFQCKNSTLPQGTLAKGATFSFPVIWNLTQASINNAQNTSFGRVLPGVQSTVLSVLTTNAVPGFSTDLPISLSGTTISNAPFLSISPKEVDFGGIVLGSAAQSSGLSSAIIISNLGNQPLIFTGFAWDDALATDEYHNLTLATDGSTIIGNYFTSESFPSVGSGIPVGGSITIPLNFKADVPGTWSSILTFFSNGGDHYALLVGSASQAPVVSYSVSSLEGWDYSEPAVLDFGSVVAGSTATKNIRVCNSGGSALTITKSKPPTQPELTASNPTVDLHEGQAIPINSCALGPVTIPAAFSGPNRPPHTVSDVWILNTDGLKPDGTPSGVHDISISATITSRQIGVLLPNGTALYQYLGCYADGSGRNFPTQISYNATQRAANENGQCQKDCFAKGFMFAGTQYRTECWCGNSPPSALKLSPESSKKCAFSCTGDSTQACGGDGTYMSVFYDISRYSPAAAPLSSSSSSQVARLSKSSSVSSGTASSISITATLSGSLRASTVSSASIISYSTSSSQPLSSATSLALGSYTSIGCWAEPEQGGHTLKGAFEASDLMTLEFCATSCGGLYQYWGIEYGRECYCGNSLAGATQGPIGDCQFPCPGNASQVCGAGNRLSLYNATVPIVLPPTPSIVPLVGPYSFIGCQTEAIGMRALRGLSAPDDNMTNELCAASCAGFIMFGTEYGRECYCGNSLGPGSVPAPVTDCSFQCPGNKGELCGAGQRLNLYSILPTTSSSIVPPSTSPSLSLSSSLSISALSSVASLSSSSKFSVPGLLSTSSTYSSPLSSTLPLTASLSTASSLTTLTLSSTTSSTFGNLSTSTPSSIVRTMSSPSTISLSGSSSSMPNLTSYATYSVPSSSKLSLSDSSTAPRVPLSSFFSPATASSSNTVPILGTTNSSSIPDSSSRASSWSSQEPAVTTPDSFSIQTRTSLATSPSSGGSSAPTIQSRSTTSVTSSTKSATDEEVASVPSSLSTSRSSTTSKPSVCRSSSKTSSSSIARPSKIPSILSSKATSTTLLTQTSKTSSTALQTGSWGYIGCFADVSGHSMKSILNADNMNPAVCIAAARSRLAASPATTYRYVGVEYGRECYGATVAPAPIPTSLVGKKACTMTCKGNVPGAAVETCGGRMQFNLYASVTGNVFAGPVATAAVN